MAESNKLHKILIVDDEPFNCRILKLKFENAGYNVITGSNGEEGLSKYKSEFPDVVISDIRMPKMNGIEMCKSIKEESKSRPYLTIVITSTVEVNERSFLNDIGNAILLEKPVSPSLLLKTVEDYLNKSAAV